MRTVAWQQATLIVLHTGLAIGNKRDLERTQGEPRIATGDLFPLTPAFRVLAAFSSMPITFARRQGWFKEPKIDETHEQTFSLEERWKRWRDREEIKRLGFAALVSWLLYCPRLTTRGGRTDAEQRRQVFDSMGTALWNHESSSLYLDAAKTTLPCHDALWVRYLLLALLRRSRLTFDDLSLSPSSLSLFHVNRKRPPPPPGNPSSAARSSPRAA